MGNGGNGGKRRGGVYVDGKVKLAEMGNKISERGNSIPELTSAGRGGIRDLQGLCGLEFEELLYETIKI